MADISVSASKKPHRPISKKYHSNCELKLLLAVSMIVKSITNAAVLQLMKY